MKEYSNIDDYILNPPPEVQNILRKVQKTIQDAAHEAVPCIKYGMPTYVLIKNLVHFAAWKEHIGFYPTPSAIRSFSKQLLKYNCSKGAIQFPIDKEIPYQLISDIVSFRVKEVKSGGSSKKRISGTKNES